MPGDNQTVSVDKPAAVALDPCEGGPHRGGLSLKNVVGAVRFPCRVKVSAAVPGDVPPAGQFLV